jgi:hypothetical protein
VVRDGIPSLTDPPLVGKDDVSLDYLSPQSRVIGLVLDDQPIAVPHAILWWHEIVNLNRGGEAVAVTFCPLTGSSLGFDRSAIGSRDLGVSGLLFDNNLIMFDRSGGPSAEESLWPQMLSEARCGPADGMRLPQVAVIEMSWEGWKDLHPNTLAISSDLDFDRNYNVYPYGSYASLGDAEFFFPMPIVDDRRRQKEPVIGIPDYRGGGIAFATLAMNLLGNYAAVEETFEGEPVVLFWDNEKKGGMAYRTLVEGEQLTFVATDAGIFDEATGSRWNVIGRAVGGPLKGAELEPIRETYVAFWGAWINFHRESRLWAG